MTRPTRIADARSPHWRAALVLAALALAGCARTIDVREPTEPTGVAPVSTRISDQVIAADLGYIQSLRARLKKLNDAGRPLDEYSMCKAQAWVDFGYSEYTDNDRAGIVEEALAEADTLIKAMEAGGARDWSDTPVTPHSQRVREDLWTFIAERKAAGPASNGDAPACAACSLAKLEVQLVWIGNEYRDLGWRHADSEIRAAERYRKAVGDDLAHCAAAPSPAACPPAPAVPQCPVVPAVSTSARGPLMVPIDVHFAFDRSAIANRSAAILSRIADVLRQHPEVTATLTATTDVRGTDAYNAGLSMRRGEAVKVYLIAAGVDEKRLTVKAAGELRVEDPALRPIDAFARARRVEFTFEGLRDIETERQLLDLQPDH